MTPIVLTEIRWGELENLTAHLPTTSLYLRGGLDSREQNPNRVLL